MLREFEISDPGAAPESARLSVDDLLRYGEIITRVVLTLKSIDSMAVGAKTKLDTIKVRARGEEFEWQMGEISRTK